MFPATDWVADRVARRVCQSHRIEDCLNRRPSAPGPFDLAQKACFLAGRTMVGPREHHQIGALERGFRFPQQTSRQQMAGAPGIKGVDQHNIQVAGKPAVLKTIVENQHVGAVQLAQASRADFTRSGDCK